MSRLPEGVSVQIFRGYEPVDFDTNGYLGFNLFEAKESVRIRVETPTNIRGFHVIGTDKEIHLKRDISETPEYCVFEWNVTIRRAGDGTLCTKYKLNNNMRLLVLRDDGMGIDVWTIALISQNGHFFITSQLSYEAPCFRDQEGNLSCPVFSNWPDIMVLLDQLVENEIISLSGLPPLPEEESSEEISSPVADNEGIVLWLDLAQGYGLVQTAQGTAIAHWSQVEQRNGLAYLGKGERVRFAAAVRVDGGSFPLELYQIEQIEAV